MPGPGWFRSERKPLLPTAGKAVVRTVMTFFLSRALHGLDGVAGVDRALEGVGRDDLDDVGDLHHVEQARRRAA